MEIKNAAFVMSNTDYKGCPEPDKPEYAFIGRSNVGKSSLINKLVNHKGLAKTSGVPGKTQLINHFLVNYSWYLVDLPGYGYAKVSKESRHKWGKMIQNYLLNRKNLVSVCVLIDARIAPQAIDLDFLRFLGESAIPFVMLFTKTDKLGPGNIKNMIEIYQNTMFTEGWEEFPHYFITSAISGAGCEELREFIAEVHLEFKAE
jgi:GTP-binding protein